MQKNGDKAQVLVSSTSNKSTTNSPIMHYRPTKQEKNSANVVIETKAATYAQLIP